MGGTIDARLRSSEGDDIHFSAEGDVQSRRKNMAPSTVIGYKRLDA